MINVVTITDKLIVVFSSARLLLLNSSVIPLAKQWSPLLSHETQKIVNKL